MRPEIEKAVLLMRRGGNEATEQALSLLQNTVFSFSMKVCGQREDAEDTMQEVLVKAVPFLPRLDSPKALLVWLYKVAKNRCLMSRRRSKFASKPDLSLDELMPDRKELEGYSAGINPEAFAIRGEEAGQLRAAIQKLPPQYRIVLVLRDMESLTDEEVAEITGLRPGTVRTPAPGPAFRAQATDEGQEFAPQPYRCFGGVAIRRWRVAPASALPCDVCGAFQLSGRTPGRFHVRGA